MNPAPLLPSTPIGTLIHAWSAYKVCTVYYLIRSVNINDSWLIFRMHDWCHQHAPLNSRGLSCILVTLFFVYFFFVSFFVLMKLKGQMGVTKRLFSHDTPCFELTVAETRRLTPTDYEVLSSPWSVLNCVEFDWYYNRPTAKCVSHWIRYWREWIAIRDRRSTWRWYSQTSISKCLQFFFQKKLGRSWT